MNTELLIDARMIQGEGHGIAEYVRELAFGLKQAKFAFTLLVSDQLPQDDPLRGLPHLVSTTAFLSPQELWEIPRILKKYSFKLFHSPSFSAQCFAPCPVIYTVHDLNHLHYGNIAKRLYYNTILRLALKKAALICTVSDSSREEIAHWLKVSPQKILLAPNGLQLPEIPAEAKNLLQKNGLKAEHFHFCLSNPKAHKNLNFLLSAYAEHRHKNPQAWPLVLSVKEEEVDGEKEGVIFLGSVGNALRISLLAYCGAFYFPSLYEGFGRPPLEAALLARPIVASRIPVHKEALSVVEEKLLLDPSDRSAWSAAFASAEEKSLLAPSPSSISRLRATYHKERLAETMLREYQTLLRFS